MGTKATCIVYITAGSEEEAKRLAKALVEERLAACCSIISKIQSIYSWEGKLQQENEHLIMCKTRNTLFGPLEQRVREIHSYDVPEILMVPVLDGSGPYLEWLLNSTGNSSERGESRTDSGNN